MAQATDKLDMELEHAHLLFLRGELSEARESLSDLNTRYPGNADIEQLLAEVVIRQPPPAPAPAPAAPIQRDWSRAFTVDLPRSAAAAILFGLMFAGFGVFDLVNAVHVAMESGLRASAKVVIPVGRGIWFALPASGAAGVNAAIAVIGILLLFAAWRKVIRTMESPT